MGDQLLGVYCWAWVRVGSSRLDQAVTFLVVFLFLLSLSSEVKFSLIHPRENKKQGETVSGTERTNFARTQPAHCAVNESNHSYGVDITSFIYWYILN